ncbi:hypothetical protein BC936DRAFT_141774 [Jimgerdemannia flammicorona]|uniref:Uncharacterized protein n=1 Tax=Jimgerdemannia flammicorona TaxID=994334 RepID=A0A433A1N1_9FUNG|nr:hypothetical protein BC936DRAFT_141774 [Jimgerdemannia flammicorona]
MTRNLQENKLQKQLDLNNRLREILERNAVPASEACQTPVVPLVRSVNLCRRFVWACVFSGRSLNACASFPTHKASSNMSLQPPTTSCPHFGENLRRIHTW